MRINYVKIFGKTHYTCTFKIVHELDELNEKALSEVDNRKDGKVEIVNVTVNNRKTKRSDGKKAIKSDLENLKISHSQKSASYEKVKIELSKKNDNTNIKYENKSNEKRFQMPDRRKVIYKKLRLGIIKFIYIQENMMMVKLVKFLLIQIKKENLLKH